VEYFKQSKNHKRKHDAEELDSESQKSQKKKKKTKSLEELRKSILETQQKTISRTTRRQVIEYRYFAEKKY
jgi:hypothetical protein